MKEMKTSVPPISLEEFTFPESVRQAFIDYVNLDLKHKNPYQDFKAMRYSVAYKMIQLLSHSTNDAFAVKQILNLIHRMRADDDPVAFVIHNFPVDPQKNLLATPSDPEGFDPNNPKDMGKTGFVTEWAMLAFNTASASDIFYSPKEHGGLFTHHVVARDGKADTPSNAGSGFFPVHTEGSHLKSEVIAALTLATLKNQKTSTIIIPTSVIKNALEEKLGNKFKILFEPRFKFVPGPIYESGAVEDPVIEPMIYKNDQGEITRWRLNASPVRLIAADPNDADSVEIIAQVAEVLESLKRGYTSKYGDFIFIGNIKGAAHSRTPFASEDKDNPLTNRHLLRQQTIKSDVIKKDFIKYIKDQGEGAIAAIFDLNF